MSDFYFLPLILFINVAIVSAFFVATYTHRRQREKRQKTGLQLLTGLRKLLAKAQKHRGLTTGYLNGSFDLENKIKMLQEEISTQCFMLASLGSWLKSNERWQLIEEHWQRLSSKYENNSPDNNILQHNQLIKNLLYLIDDMAQEHDLLQLKSKEGKNLQLAWCELLTAAECIGQARALGTGVVARKHCDTVSRIRLNYLSYKVEKSTHTAWAHLPPSREQKDRLQALLKYISEELLNKNLAISVGDFFNVASAAIDSLYQQFDEIIAQAK